MSSIKRERELVAVTAVGESDRDWFVCLTPVGFVWPEITASTRACGAGRLTSIPKDRVPEKPVVGQQYVLETVRGSGVVGWGTGVGAWLYHRPDTEIRSDRDYMRAAAALRQLSGELAGGSTSSSSSARSAAESLLSGMGRRWRHVQGVGAAADRLASELDVGSVAGDVVRAAAWLHDIGYAPPLVDTGFHPVDGARFLRAHGVPELVVSLVAYHTGAVFEAEQRGLADELAAFAEPPSELLDVVTFADLTTGPDGAEMSVTQRLSEILVRYPEYSPVHRAVTASSPSLLAGADRVAEHLVVDPAPVASR